MDQVTSCVFKQVKVRGESPPNFWTAPATQSGNSRLGPGSGSIVDTNGNTLTAVLGSTAISTTRSVPATPVLTVTGAGTASSPSQFSYTNPGGNASKYVINYTNYTIQTNFGCSSVAEYSASSQPLISSINLPDGTSYSFTYENTPGSSTNVTGRLHSVSFQPAE